jgi:hypothetical protein
MRLLLMICVFFYIAGCGSATSEVPSASAGVPEQVKIAWDPSSGCFDTAMESWFFLFNGYQESGLNMAQADAQAMKDLELSYDSCTSTGAHHPDKRPARK